MRFLFLKKFLKGVSLPHLSLSFEDEKIVFVVRENQRIKNYLIENLDNNIVRLIDGEWKVELEEGKVTYLSKRIKSQNFKKINNSVLLIPDFLTNVFIISFENLPKNKLEAESLIKWRAEKQFPLREEVILRYKLFMQNKDIKVLAVSVPKSIIQQFIETMEKGGIKTPFITIPIFTFHNFIRKISSSKNGVIIVNRLSMGTSLFGFTPSFPVIFRSKIGNLTKREIIEEVLSTMKWIQDKENVKIDEIWIRDISEERWDDLEKPFLSISSLEGKIQNIKFLAPHLGIPEWTE